MARRRIADDDDADGFAQSMLPLGVVGSGDASAAVPTQLPAPPAVPPARLARAIEPYNHALGEYWWLWSGLWGYVFALVVGVAEGMPNNTPVLCRSRWALACAGALLQVAVTVTCTIPLQLALLGATGALICVLAGLTAAMVFTEDDASSSGDDAAANGIAVVGTLNAVLGIALMAFAAVRFGYELWEMQKRHHEREKGGRGGDRRHRWRWAAEEENEASDLPIDDGLSIVLPIVDDATDAKEGMGGARRPPAPERRMSQIMMTLETHLKARGACLLILPLPTHLLAPEARVPLPPPRQPPPFTPPPILATGTSQRLTGACWRRRMRCATRPVRVVRPDQSLWTDVRRRIPRKPMK